MAELVPLDLEVLLRRMASELAAGACFDLPARSFHRPEEGLDLSVRFHGERAGTPLGPAAGPHSQLAQNIALAYLGGSRVIELKTVQVNDHLALPRPCIDAANVGFNVEWSQELRLEQSRAEYVKAWVLLHALRHHGAVPGLAGREGEVLFDMSVGYDLAGIRSAPVRRFIDGLLDARAEIDALFDRWPKDLLAWRPERERVPDRISNCITLSTFHGCPAEEIERICEHLLAGAGVHVVAKLNPTLLGYEGACSLLHGALGYDEIRPHRESFEKDLQFDDAVELCHRLASFARGRRLTFGAKLSNTLVVENHKSFFPASEKLMYLSGAPLHVLTFALCRRFREAYGAPLPISFSAGVDSRNFPDCVAAGFAPVTTCTDLLKPGGYGRLPRYLQHLGERMRARGVDSVPDFILAEAGRKERVATADAEDLPRLLHNASMHNHARATARVLMDDRYTAKRNRAVPRKLGSKLWFFDCIACDKCVQVCPNDANFTLQLPEAFAGELKLRDLVVRGGALVDGPERASAFREKTQLATFADGCNECGNCDVFCPEEGGPYVVKPRFFSSRARMEQAPARLEGFAVEREDGWDRLVGRHEGARLSLELDRARRLARFDDGQVRLELDCSGFQRLGAEVRPTAEEGHVVRLDRARAMAALLAGVLAEGAVSWASAPFLRR